MTIEHTLVNWAASVDTCPGQAQLLARDALVDIVACMIGGSVQTSTQSIIKVAQAFASGAALAMGSDMRMPAPWAAFVSGTAAHSLDFDDNFAPATTHATAVLAPALFALADEEELSGADVLNAYIVGLELQARIGRLVNPGHYEKGWHATSTVGAIGAAVGCAHLLRLDADQTLAAMSIACSMASGSKKQFGSMMKPVHAGFAAKNAVLAARMAQAGITGDTEPLSGHWGFSELYGAGNTETARSLAVGDLGKTLAIETDGLLFKRFPCCGAAQRTLDGLVQLREQHGFLPEAVDHVEAFIPAFARANLRFDEPRNEDEARFSLTYCAARILHSGKLTLRDMTLERVRDPSMRPWLRRFTIHTKPGSVCEELSGNATPAITRVTLKSGVVHETGIRVPKGSRDAPLTEQERRDKFRDCCQWAGKADAADRLFELARSIHEVPHFPQFSRALAQALARRA